MKQITKEIVVELLQRGELELKPTQNKVCIPIINRIYKKMCIGIVFSSISVADGLIIDGHHRYIASLLADFKLERIKSDTTSATSVTDWNSVEFVEEDWDTEAKIKMLNEIDAQYNQLPLDEMVELLK